MALMMIKISPQLRWTSDRLRGFLNWVRGFEEGKPTESFPAAMLAAWNVSCLPLQQQQILAISHSHICKFINKHVYIFLYLHFQHRFIEQDDLWFSFLEFTGLSIRSYLLGTMIPMVRFYIKHGLASAAWISNYIHYKVRDEITYPFPNFNGDTV